MNGLVARGGGGCGSSCDNIEDTFLLKRNCNRECNVHKTEDYCHFNFIFTNLYVL